MAHNGFLKPSYKSAAITGFMWGFLCGACLTSGACWFEQSRYSATTHLVANLTRFLWNMLVIPAAMIAPLFGIDLQLHPDLVEAGDLGFMILANGMAFGAVGVFVSWRLTKARIQAESPRLSKTEHMLTEGVPVKTIYWKAVRRRGVWGILFGFIFNSAIMGISFSMSGGHSVTGLVVILLCWPTVMILHSLGWQQHDINAKIVAMSVVINPILIGILVALGTAAIESGLFFRKR